MINNIQVTFICYKNRVLQPPKFDKIPKEKSISSFYVDQIIKCENRVCPHEGSCDHFISNVSIFFIFFCGTLCFCRI